MNDWWFKVEGEDEEATRIGERIAARMQEIEMEVEELASILDKSTDTIYKLRRGETVSRWLDLIKLARTLRTSPNGLLGFEGDTRGRLRRLLVAAFQGLGADSEQAQSYTRTFLEALDKRSNPDESVSEEGALRIEVAFAKRRFERP